MRRTLWALLVSALAVLVLTSAACSSGDEGSSGASATSATSAETGGGETRTPEDGTGVSGEPDLKAEDFQFDPSEVKAASGDTIIVKNDAPSTPHTFTVTDTDIDQSLDPDQSYKVKIDLDPGTYDFMCTIHPQMTGTLTVT